jgi:hypothetical protein
MTKGCGALILAHAGGAVRDRGVEDVGVGTTLPQDAPVAVAVLHDADGVFKDDAEGAPQGRALIRREMKLRSRAKVKDKGGEAYLSKLSEEILLHKPSLKSEKTDPFYLRFRKVVNRLI